MGILFKLLGKDAPGRPFVTTTAADLRIFRAGRNFVNRELQL